MKDKILIVDDDENILTGYKRSLQRQFKVETAQGGEEGLKMISEVGPYAVVISDMRMPGMDGTSFFAQVRERFPESVRILLTGQANMADAVKVVNEGDIFRFLTKPCTVEHLSQAITDGLDFYGLRMSEKEVLNQTLKGIIKLLIDMMSLVNPWVFNRSIRVRKVAGKVASRLNLKDLWQVDVAALLSQIGCLTLPKELLKRKFDGLVLSKEEEELYNKRLRVGGDLLTNIPRLEEIAEGIAYQEKKFDGGGLPRDAVRGNKIPFLGRLLFAVHQYDELVEAGNSPENAVEKMYEDIAWYDPDILAALNAEVMRVKEGFLIREINAGDIKVGMVLADDIRTKTDLLLVAKDQEISNTLRMCVLNFVEKENVIEPIKILDWVRVDSA